MLDVILRGGTVYDGTGAESSRADIGVTLDRIAAIGDLSAAFAPEIIDCTGLCVLPGFIDSHTHADLYLLRERAHARSSLQGVTTEVVSPCGLGVYPLSRGNLRAFSRYLRGLLGPIDEKLLDFTDTAGYLRAVSGASVNVVSQISHGALRMEAMGFRAVRANQDQFSHMKRLMREAAEQGCAAFSTGLSYYPATYALDDEVIDLCKFADKLSLPLAVHCRTVFPDARYGMPTRYQEFLDIGRESGCHVHFSHTKHPRGEAGHPQDFLKTFEEAMDKGQRVTMEMYPYPSGAGFAMIFLPGWALEGGPDATLVRLRDSATRARLLDALVPDETKISWGILGHLERHTEFLGQTFGQIAVSRGETARETLLWLLDEENLAVGYQSNPPVAPDTLAAFENDYATLLAKPYYMIGSDSEPGQALAHPRTAGTFVKMFRLAREAGLSPALFAQRASGNPARLFGLKDRGVIREGAFADLVVLREDTVRETCTFQNPDGVPEGICHVLVNGRATVRGGVMTGALPGRGLERGR